jgi:hypothetical protein
VGLTACEPEEPEQAKVHEAELIEEFDRLEKESS